MVGPPLSQLAPPAPSPVRAARVEYLGFETVAEHREFRLRVYGADGSTEFRFRIPIAAAGDGRIRLQDGPDICYQKLLRVIAAGETASADVILIDDADFALHREAHTKVQKHRRSWTPPSPSMAAPAPAVVPRHRQRRTPPPPVAPIVTRQAEPAFEEGQRVSHAVFGVGVTAASSGGRTVVCFDKHGAKKFITSMLKVDVLSAPHMWETGAKGRNRPRTT